MSKDKAKNSIYNFLVKPFTLLDTTKDKLFLVVFCGIFATLFLSIYKPLNISYWLHDSPIGNFLTIWSAGILGALLLSVTQFIIRPRLKLNTFNIGQFSLWVLFEFLLLTILFFVLYKEDNNNFWSEFLLVFRYTFYLTVIPYFFACLLIAVRKLSEKVKQEEQTQQIEPIKPAKAVPVITLAQHSFKDENGKIMLAIKPQQLLLLKSENNYISVFFLQNEKVEKKLIRTNLKKLENELKAFPYLFRIHRSYMVNLDKIASVDRIKGSFQILLTQLPEMPLKVSETFKTSFEAQMKN